MPRPWSSIVCCFLQLLTTVYVVFLISFLLFPIILIRKVCSYIGALMTGYEGGLPAKVLISRELEVLRRNIKILLADDEYLMGNKVRADESDDLYWDALSYEDFPPIPGKKISNDPHVTRAKPVDLSDLHDGLVNRSQSNQHAVKRETETKVL